MLLSQLPDINYTSTTTYNHPYIKHYQWATERAFWLSFGRWYRQKFSRNVFLLFLAFLPICRKRIFWQKERLSAEMASFCSLFASNWDIFPLEEDFWARRKRPFLHKDSLSAEKGSFSSSAEMTSFVILSYCFQQKEEISLSVAHWALPYWSFNWGSASCQSLTDWCWREVDLLLMLMKYWFWIYNTT